MATIPEGGSGLIVHEIFDSFQGEGILVGVPQVFLRLSGCNLDCSYCDTPEARGARKEAVLVRTTGEMERLINPLSVAEVSGIVDSLWHAGMHSVSITGGEPLLQAAELEELLPFMAGQGKKVYLETNGTLHERLDGLLPWLDWIAMDVKLPSTQGVGDVMESHRLFLEHAGTTGLFMKMVVERGTAAEEVLGACRLLSPGRESVPLVLQPATPMDGGAGIDQRELTELYRAARDFFHEVRVIPQMHRLWGAR